MSYFVLFCRKWRRQWVYLIWFADLEKWSYQKYGTKNMSYVFLHNNSQIWLWNKSFAYKIDVSSFISAWFSFFDDTIDLTCTKVRLILQLSYHSLYLGNIDIGDKWTLVTLCWWQFIGVGDKPTKTVINILNLSPRSVTNIDVAWLIVTKSYQGNLYSLL